MGNFATFMQETHKDKTEKEEKDKEEKEKKEQKEEEKEEKEKAEKEKKEQKEEEKEERLRQWMETMEKEKNRAIQYLANMDNQTVPQKYITGGTLGGNISTITSTSSSNNQIVESPRSFVRTPRRQQHQDRVTAIVTAEQTTKKRKSNERIDDRDHEDRSKITATTIGTESQTEQSSHDLENGDDSKQYHDVQNGSEMPTLH